jgi:hypothetical protein
MSSILHARPLAVAEELSSWLPWRPRLAAERWLGTLHAIRPALRRRPVRRLAGTARADGGPLALVTDLKGDAIRFWTTLLFRDEPTSTPLGSASALGRFRMGRGADLALLSHHRAFRRAAARHGYLTVPAWLDTGIRLATSVDATLDGLPYGRSSRQSDLRRIRRAGLRAELRHDAGDIRTFLREWYLPFVHARWGDTCVDLDHGWMHRAERFCELLWVLRGDERIAGVLIESQGPTMRMVVLGMQQPDQRRDGALAAAYYFSIVEAVRRGQHLIRTGGVRPVLGDGVLEFKRKWGAGIRPAHQLDHLALAFRFWSPTIRALFAEHPVVVETTSGEYLALTDATAASPTVDGRFEVEGLAGILAPDDAGALQRIPLPVAGPYLPRSAAR